MKNAVIFVVSTILAVAWSYPTTVPPSPEVCSKMTPGHGPSPQKSQAPYTVQVSTTNVKGGNNVQVKLSGIGKATFKGFYVQARDAQGNRVGTFIPDDGVVKSHGCGGIKNNAAHQSGKDDKQAVTVYWKAPQAFNGQVTFVVTFVEEFETFWTNVKSVPVTVSNSEQIISATHHLTDSREESTTTKTAQEGRILNYNPYSPFSPLKDPEDSKGFKDFLSPFPPENIYSTNSPSDKFGENAFTNKETSQKRGLNHSSRVRKSYFIPKQSPFNEFQQDPVVISEGVTNCKTFGHSYLPHQFKEDTLAVLPAPVVSVYTQNAYGNYRNPTNPVSNLKFPSNMAQGGGFNRLDPILPTPYSISSNMRPHGYNFLNRGTSFPVFHTPPIGYGSPKRPVSTAYFDGKSHGVLINDPDVINTGIVIPQNMKSFEIPRYGYLIFNPKRGPPFYLIPAETSSFENYFGRSFRKA